MLKLVPEREYTTSTRDPVYNLRTVDYVMRPVTLIDRTYPPNLVRRLFAGNEVRIVDLRDEETMRGIDQMLHHELSSVIDPNMVLDAMGSTDLESGSGIFEAAAVYLFPLVRSKLLSGLADCYHRATHKYKDESFATLPPPLRGDELDMEVTWVKELSKRITIRPVHVFVRDEGNSET